VVCCSLAVAIGGEGVVVYCGAGGGAQRSFLALGVFKRADAARNSSHRTQS
jgi:hypothetical protein